LVAQQDIQNEPELFFGLMKIWRDHSDVFADHGPTTRAARRALAALEKEENRLNDPNQGAAAHSRLWGGRMFIYEWSRCVVLGGVSHAIQDVDAFQYFNALAHHPGQRVKTKALETDYKILGRVSELRKRLPAALAAVVDVKKGREGGHTICLPTD
jgi:hypothetical protein